MYRLKDKEHVNLLFTVRARHTKHHLHKSQRDATHRFQAARLAFLKFLDLTSQSDSISATSNPHNPASMVQRHGTQLYGSICLRFVTSEKEAIQLNMHRTGTSDLRFKYFPERHPWWVSAEGIRHTT